MGKTSERNFEYRIQKFLEKHGYLCINCARSKPFDLVAIKIFRAIPIELKAKAGRYPRSQLDQQIKLAKKSRTGFLIVKQSKTRGKIHLSAYDPTLDQVTTHLHLIPELLELVED